MANEDLRVRISAQVQGLDQVESLKNAVRQLQGASTPAAADLQKLKNAAMQLGSASGRTESDLRRSINALKDVRAQLSITGAEYRKLTGTISKYQAQLDKATGAQQQGGRGMRMAQTAGAVAASGVFGGPEGLIGAALGSFGGAGGALAGGAIGAQVGMVRQGIGAMADYSAQIDRLKIALKGITQSSAEYEAALGVVNRATTTFNVTKDEAIKGFTSLSASVIGAGGKIRDAEIVFNGVSAAIRATGGSAEDVQGALVAMAQVFSKGKATAEEIQGQLGERLPGAVTLFAQSTGRTGAELAKAFEQGTVGLNDVMKFAIALGDKFGETNDKIAASSEAAGDRMKVAFGLLREELGRTVQPLGAALQDMTADLAEAGAQMLLTARNSGELNAALAEVRKNSTSALQAQEELRKRYSEGPPTQGLADYFFGTGDLEGRLAKTDTQLQFSITRFYEAEGAVNAHRKALLSSGQTLEEQGKAVDAAEGAMKILEGRLNTLRIQNKENTKEAEFYRAKVAELKGVLESVKGSYKAKIEIQQIFKGEAPQINRGGKTSIPEGYRVVAGKLAYLSPGQGYVDALTGKPIFDSGTPADRGQSTFQDPSGQDGIDKSAEKARLAAERLAKQEQQLALQTAEQQRTLDNKIFQNQIELDRRRYELQQQLIDLQAQNEIDALTNVAKEYAGRADQFRKQLRDMYRQGTEASLQASIAQQQMQSARSVQSVTGGGIATTGMIARTGNTGDSTGAHLDLRWGDGRPITRSDADKYFLINGKAPSSFGVTSPYGPRKLFGRNFHSGIDFGTPAGSALSLKGGATFSRDLGNTGAGGYALEVMTPEGTMKALHLMAKSVTVSGTNRSQVKTSGLVGGETQDAAQANAMRDLQLKDQAAKAEQMIGIAVKQNTAAVRERIAAIADENELNQVRFRLQMEGARPEVIEREVEALKLRQQQLKETTIAQAVLNQKEAELAAIKDKQSVPARILTGEIEVQKRTIAELPGLYDNLRYSLEGVTAAQIAFNDAMRFRQDDRIGEGMQEGVNSYIESIGTMRKATEELTLNGIKGVENAIFDLVTTGKTNFREFAADILRQTARMIIQQLVLRNVMLIVKSAFGFADGGVFGGGGGGLGSVQSNLAQYAPLPNAMGNAFAKNNILPFAQGGIVNKPTLFKFANGGAMSTGVMGEAGPEAIIPLKRGRDGRLGVSGGNGGGSTNVVVNVDASGSKVQGDNSKGEQLGRAVSQAVQDELLRQKRPGGLLAA